MSPLTLAAWVALAAVGAPSPADGAGPAPAQGIHLTGSPRSASLLQDAGLDASWRPSTSPALRLTDDVRLLRSETPLPLDQGGGVSSDLRQILALVLGFVPGFGLGHLVARDRDGFILFLVVDVALYVLWGTVGWWLWHPFGFIGGALWLVVHVIQALDAYAEAGGPRIVQLIRDTTVEVASSTAHRLDPPRVTAKIFEYSF
ncbi:MAG: hypothetical protein IRZ16_10115 [Myxococcaceae bacterium]|nr:hypothetical protein [Myxococcaceae bacterium]